MNQKAAESQMLIDSLLAERQQLLAEINVWRAGAGIEPVAILPATVDENSIAQPCMESLVTPRTMAGLAGGLSPLDHLDGNVAMQDGGSFTAHDFGSSLEVLSPDAGDLGLDSLPLVPWDTPNLSVSVVGVPNYTVDSRF
jgi:hypothetical protein